MENKEKKESLRQEQIVEFLYEYQKSEDKIEPVKRFAEKIEQEIDRAETRGFRNGRDMTVQTLQQALDSMVYERQGERIWLKDIMPRKLVDILPKQLTSEAKEE